MKARTYCDKVVIWVNCFWTISGAAINGLAKVHDEGNWGRKAVSYATLIATGRALYWAIEFASNSTRPGIEVAAIIAAVVAPLGIVQGAVAKFYFEANTRTEQLQAGVTNV